MKRRGISLPEFAQQRSAEARPYRMVLCAVICILVMQSLAMANPSPKCQAIANNIAQLEAQVKTLSNEMDSKGPDGKFPSAGQKSAIAGKITPIETKIAQLQAQLNACLELALGRYCSMTWSNGGWALVLYPNLTQDPCVDIEKKSDPGGTIERAGLYAVNDMNNVVARCGVDAGWIQLYQAYSDGPFTSAYNKAHDEKQKHCVFTAAPLALPIFDTPFPLGTSTTHVTGVDFARDPYKSLNLANDYGQPGASTAADIVDWKGRYKPKYIDNHDGHDILVATGTEIRAVAPGTVIAARFRDVTNTGCSGDDKQQGEVWVEHVVSGKTGKVSTGGGSTLYDEHYITFYAHLSKIDVTNGEIVGMGTKLGLSGATGCTGNTPHLHFGTFKTTNTAGYHLFPTQINKDFSKGKDQNSANLFKTVIEPYGWAPPAGFDPWAWRAYNVPGDMVHWGAISTNLWVDGQAPGTNDW